MRAIRIKVHEPMYRDDGVIQQAVYRLEPALDFSEYVLVSASTVLGTPETFIFACESDGEVTDWRELEGSYCGGMDHEHALRGAGYTDIEYGEVGNV